MQDMLPGVLSTVLTLFGPTVTNSSSLPIECRMTVNSSVLHSSSRLSISRQAGIGIGEYSLLMASNSSLIFSSEVVIILYGIRRIVGEKIRRLDCKTQYAVQSRMFDTSYPTGGYGVSIVPADSSSSIPADNVPAGSSSSIPADYVSAGHVLVSADRDRIC
ncbi:hypothetical protein Tco_0067107 [Tanacetum coccineum]